MLEGRSIHSRDADWCHKLMMLLMKGSVEPFVVQEAMCVIKENLLAREAYKKISHDNREAGNVSRNFDIHPIVNIIIKVKRECKTDQLIFYHNFDNLRMCERRKKIINKKMNFDSFLKVLHLRSSRH
jgi:hypothetical protein